MIHAVEVASKVGDGREVARRKRLQELGFKVDDVKLVDVYTLDVPEGSDVEKKIPEIADGLHNPVTQEVRVDSNIRPVNFNYAVEIGFLPGVTDNVGSTARQGVEELVGSKLSGQVVHTSQRMFLSGNLGRYDAEEIGRTFANPLIQRISVYGNEEIKPVVPIVHLVGHPGADLVDIIDASEQELQIIGKCGIANADGTKRGPLAMGLPYMKAVQEKFRKLGRNPTDFELESVAQTWSEHCKHTIFADPIDGDGKGLFKGYIKRATDEIIEDKRKSGKNICVSVFTDNSGAIHFEGNDVITHKVETHNSPSALDPYGGSITGIVGVNRDTIGFGMGAKPVANVYGFCFADPKSEEVFYRDKNMKQPVLSPRRIMNGVIDGVNVGGNCSGIPTPQGFMRFHGGYAGKPLVFVGTVGMMPRTDNGKSLIEKKAEAGDYIVMAGGRVGLDGIHGATFSSEGLDAGSPATAVQIGDPITQKKMSDALVKEARQRGLYRSITDNGAGGLSCSVAEMAKESGGFEVDLEKVPLKYPGLAPWQTWISESQERMTLAVPPEDWAAFSNLMERRGVEATRIGTFTDSGKCVVDYKGTRVMDMDMEFLHNGLPKRELKSTFRRGGEKEPEISPLENLTESLHEMLGRNNIASNEFVSRQYDHEVQGGSVLKPVQGRGRVNADATVIRPKLSSPRAVALSQALFPEYSEIDTYNMAAVSVDSAVRNAVAIGADPERIAILDNFCWCSSDEPERLGQLKRAAQACYDSARVYGTPFISGKDSMFNDFKGFDKDGKPVKISVPPTLLISSIGIVEDAGRAVSLDSKMEGDAIYVLGSTLDELGGSEFYAMVGEKQRGKAFVGNNVPGVDTHRNWKSYMALANAINEGLVASAQSVNRGGLGVALAKKAMGGMLGMNVDLSAVPGMKMRDDFELYSESAGRVVVTVNPKLQRDFESVMKGNRFSQVGNVRGDDKFVVRGRSGKDVVNTSVGNMIQAYRTTFRGY